MTNRRSKVIATTAALVLIATWLASRFPDFVESVYSERFFPLEIRFLTAVSGLFPFSLAEVLMFSALVWLAASLLRAAHRLATRSKKLGPLLRDGAYHLTAVILVVLAWGYLFWGLNYARQEAEVRLGWNELPSGEEDDVELSRLAQQAVNLVNSSFVDSHGGEGSPLRTGSPSSLSDWDRNLDEGYAAAAAEFSLGPPFGLSLGPAKPFVGSSLMSRFGISGFYFPWTGEANYNRLVPEPERIHSIAHEKAHQRGIASEDEASFYGFLACVLSRSPETRYAGWLFAQRQLLNQLAGRDLEKARAIAAQRLAGVVRDERRIREFWEGYRGAATKVGAAVNNSYLRLHGVPGGIDSYNRAVRLLVLMARERGTLVIAPSAGN